MEKMIAPSLLSADFTKLEIQIKACEDGNAKLLHCDIMDGHFVPNLTFGPFIVKQINKITRLPLDAHLMVTNPDDYIQAFAEAGVQYLTVHQETVYHLHRTIQNIKALGIKAGVALNPATPVYMLNELFDELDLILIMSVNPGFGGQKFIPNALNKIRELAELREKYNYNYLIQVDGGVSIENINEISDAGCDIFVAGSSIFGTEDISKTVKIMDAIVNKY